MVSPIGGFSRSIPLMQATGTPPAGGGASGTSPVAQPTTPSEALKFVADLWVPIKATDMEGRRSLRAEDARLQHWYYPKLGAALAAEYRNPRARALRNLSRAQTASQLLIAITNANNNGYDITGNEIKQAAVKLDPGFLKQSVKICLDNIINSTNYRQGVDADHYENQLYRILTSPSRSGASRASVTPAVIAALKSMHSGTTADAAADALLKDGRFKLTGVAPAAGAGAAPSGALAGYPAKAIELAREIVVFRAKAAGELLTDGQVNERAEKLLVDSYKGYLDYPSTMVDQLKAERDAESKKTGSPGFVLNMSYNSRSAKGSTGTTKISGAIDPDKFKYSIGGSKTSIVLRKFNFEYNSGKAEKQGLNATDAFTGPLWTLQNKDAANGEAAVGLSHTTEGDHTFSGGGGYRTPLNAEKMGDGKWNAFVAYKTPSFSGLRASAELLVEAETPGQDDGSKTATLQVAYTKPDAKPEDKKSIVVVASANLKGEIQSQKGVLTSKIVGEAAVNVGDRTTVGIECTYVDPGASPHKDCSVTGTVKVGGPMAFELKGSAALDEGTVSYGLPNAGVDIEGKPLPSQPSEHNSTTTLSVTAKIILSLNKFIDLFVGGGVATYNTAVEDRDRGQLEGVFTAGVKIKDGK